MTKYNYLEAVKDDVRNYIEEEDYIAQTKGNRSRDEIYEELHDVLWTEDSVTGNASGSYTFNMWQAEEYLCHNLDLLQEATKELGYESEFITNNLDNPETLDILIRCYLLDQAIYEVIEEEGYFE